MFAFVHYSCFHDFIEYTDVVFVNVIVVKNVS